MSRIAKRLFVSLLFAAGAMAAAAADFPSRPVRLVVPFPPGGALDVVARLIAAKLPDTWHQPVIVENRPGAVGTIGVDYVAKSPPDGHALVITAWSLIVATPQIQRTPYDFARDLVAVVQTADLTYVLAASLGTGVSNIGDLIALARKNPGHLNYASPGNGSGQHLYAELVKRAAKIDVTHVPYKGEGPALQALLTGEVNLFFGTTGSLLPHVKAGKVRALMVTGTKPLEGFSNVPPMETVYPGMGMSMTGWHGIFAPAATPKAIVDQIASSVRAAVLSPDVSSRFRDMGFEATGITSERFGEIVLRDYERWGQLVRENNIRAD